MRQACPQLRSVPPSDAESVVNEIYKDNGALILSYVTGLLKDRYLAEDGRGRGWLGDVCF